MLEVKGIKCDNESCDYQDMSVQAEEYPDYVNKPCPKCGENLFTEADYKSYLIMVKIFNNPIIKMVDKFCGLFSKKKKMEVKMDGSGKVQFEDSKKEDDKKEEV